MESIEDSLMALNREVEFLAGELQIRMIYLCVSFYLILAVAVLGSITASPYMPSYGRTDMRAHWMRSVETPYRVKWNRGRFRILFKRQKTKILNLS